MFFLDSLDSVYVVDFLLVLIELFSLGVTAGALRVNIGWKSVFSLQRGQFDPKFQVEGVAFHQSFSLSQTEVNGLSCDVRMLAQVSFVLSQITRLSDGRTDARTDRQTPFS